MASKEPVMTSDWHTISNEICDNTYLAQANIMFCSDSVAKILNYWRDLAFLPPVVRRACNKLFPHCSDGRLR